MERDRRFLRWLSGRARSARRNDDVLVLYNAEGFALALGPADEPLARPACFGMRLSDRDALAYASATPQWVDELAAEGHDCGTEPPLTALRMPQTDRQRA